MLSFLQRLNRQIARDGGEPFEELFQGFAAFEIFEERLDRHPCPTEHRNAMHCFRIAGDRSCHVFIVSQTGSRRGSRDCYLAGSFRHCPEVGGDGSLFPGEFGVGAADVVGVEGGGVGGAALGEAFGGDAGDLGGEGVGGEGDAGGGDFEGEALGDELGDSGWEGGEPGGGGGDDFFGERIAGGIVDGGVEVAAAGVEDGGAEGGGGEACEGFEVGDGDGGAGEGFGEAFDAGEGDTDAGEGSGAGGGGEAIDVGEVEGVAGEEGGDFGVEQVREAGGGVDGRLFEEVLIAKQGEAAVFGGGIDGEDEGHQRERIRD
jgi:hypothetical protein